MDDTDDRILDAASRLHAERGFRGTTTRSIAREAGVNEVTIFRHFDSKEAIFVAAARRGSDELIYRFSQHPLPGEPRDIRAELTYFLDRTLEGLLASQQGVRTGLGEWGRRPAIDREKVRGPEYLWSELRRYLAAARDRGLVRHDADPDAAASLIVGSVFADGILREPLPERYPHDPEATVRHYVGILLDGLLPGGAGGER